MKNTSAILAGIVASLLLGGGLVWAQNQGQPAANSDAIPDLSSGGRTWVLINGTQFYKVPGDTGPGPVDDKAYPNGEFAKLGQGGGTRLVNRIADTSNPILKPWAKKLMEIANERVAKGGIPFVDASRCWLAGVPSLLLFPGEAMVFLQTPKEVWLLSKRDSQVRRIFMNVPHSKNPGYSMTGESVGHYENGDTLVVDTIGLDDKGPLDRYRTPHTKLLHVVERFKLAPDRKNIQITFTVEDPGAFTMPWKGMVTWRAGTPPRSDHWEEDICADNGDGYGFDPDQLVPAPHADKADF